MYESKRLGRINNRKSKLITFFRPSLELTDNVRTDRKLDGEYIGILTIANHHGVRYSTISRL